jgi:surfactin synthase thioesterase subunit
MGSTIAFLVARKINALKLRSPDHIFVSGRAGPSIQRNITSIANLPKQQFLEKLRVLGGSPPEFLEDEELVHYFEPILRSDFKAVETYQYTPGTLLEIPITCMIGSEEDVTVDEAKAWQNETTKPVCFKQFIGGHFFILEHEQNIVALIEKSLSR